MMQGVRVCVEDTSLLLILARLGTIEV